MVGISSGDWKAEIHLSNRLAQLKAVCKHFELQSTHVDWARLHPSRNVFSVFAISRRSWSWKYWVQQLPNPSRMRTVNQRPNFAEPSITGGAGQAQPDALSLSTLVPCLHQLSSQSRCTQKCWNSTEFRDTNNQLWLLLCQICARRSWPKGHFVHHVPYHDWLHGRLHPCHASSKQEPGSGVVGFLPVDGPCGHYFEMWQWTGLVQLLRMTVNARLSMGLATRASTPMAYSHSNSLVENTVGRAHALAGSLMFAMREKTGIQFSTNSAWWSSALRHACWILNRFVTTKAMTVYEVAFGKPYEGALCEFGEPVFGYARSSVKTQVNASAPGSACCLLERLSLRTYTFSTMVTCLFWQGVCAELQHHGRVTFQSTSTLHAGHGTTSLYMVVEWFQWTPSNQRLVHCCKLWPTTRCHRTLRVFRWRGWAGETKVHRRAGGVTSLLSKLCFGGGETAKGSLIWTHLMRGRESKTTRILAGRFSRAERRRQRARIHLDDAALTMKTQVRSYNALRKVIPYVEKAPTEDQLDTFVCRWVRKMWRTGEPLSTIGDGLSAIHFYQPWTRRRLPHAWKLFAVWRKIEIPSRAPPITWELISSMAAHEWQQKNFEMAVILLVAFHCLLRTGEFLSITAADVSLGENTGLISLKGTKAGLRHNADEAISVTNDLVLEFLRALIRAREDLNATALPLWNGTAAQFRSRFKFLCSLMGLEKHQFRPYRTAFAEVVLRLFFNKPSQWKLL